MEPGDLVDQLLMNLLGPGITGMVRVVIDPVLQVVGGDGFAAESELRRMDPELPVFVAMDHLLGEAACLLEDLPSEYRANRDVVGSRDQAWFKVLGLPQLVHSCRWNEPMG